MAAALDGRLASTHGRGAASTAASTRASTRAAKATHGAEVREHRGVAHAHVDHADVGVDRRGRRGLGIVDALRAAQHHLTDLAGRTVDMRARIVATCTIDADAAGRTLDVLARIGHADAVFARLVWGADYGGTRVGDAGAVDAALATRAGHVGAGVNA